MRRQLAKARAHEASAHEATAQEASAREASAHEATAQEASARETTPPRAGRGGGASQAELLQEVAAWLTVNSMRTERVQFDQLCAQNLATIWRQNAWDQLLAGHEHFKVRPECVQGFVQEKLGEAYMSNRLGKVSREHIKDKSLLLLFEGKERDDELLRAMLQARMPLAQILARALALPLPLAPNL